jgi:hypothetical protein
VIFDEVLELSKIEHSHLRLLRQHLIATRPLTDTSNDDKPPFPLAERAAHGFTVHSRTSWGYRTPDRCLLITVILYLVDLGHFGIIAD